MAFFFDVNITTNYILLVFRLWRIVKASMLRTVKSISSGLHLHDIKNLDSSSERALNTSSSTGFTIVELLVVIVVIAILATIVIVAYNGMIARARDTSVKSDTESFAKAIEDDKTQNGTYPISAASANNGRGLNSGNGNTIAYNVDGTYSNFCVQVSNTNGSSYYATQLNLTPTAGTCSGTTGVPAGTPVAVTMQTITTANCPSSRTLVTDARDGNTYWAQKLLDGKCWMLTNLAYKGGGTNTYGDVKTLTDATNGFSGYGSPVYFTPPSSNPTSGAQQPSTSTDGGATSPQYGLLYNWCAAMGGQAGTAACNGAMTPVADLTISICPSGWHLPTGGTSGSEYYNLNTAINSASTTTDAGLLSAFLIQRSGGATATPSPGSLSGQGSAAYLWSSTHATTQYSYAMTATSSSVSYAGFLYAVYEAAVRCVAN